MTPRLKTIPLPLRDGLGEGSQPHTTVFANAPNLLPLEERANSATSQDGFTLLEMIVVIVILGLVAGLVLTRGPMRSTGLSARAAATMLAGSLRAARSEAIATDRPVTVLINATLGTIQVGASTPRAMGAQLIPPRAPDRVRAGWVLQRWTDRRGGRPGAPHRRRGLANRPGQHCRCPRNGFTLLEVLVAFIIAALALGALFSGGLGGLHATATSARYAEAVSRAQSHLAAATLNGALTASDRQGDDGRGFHWRVRTAPVAATASGPAAPTTPALVLYGVSAAESWTEDGHTRAVQLDTQVTALAPPAPP